MCPPGQGPVQVWAELLCSPPLKTYLMMSCSSSRHTLCWILPCHLPPINLSSLSLAGNRCLLPSSTLFSLSWGPHGMGVGLVKELEWEPGPMGCP